MKIHTGKTARAVRRRELTSKLLDIIETHGDKGLVSEARMIVMELIELATIDANTVTKPRIRK